MFLKFQITIWSWCLFVVWLGAPWICTLVGDLAFGAVYIHTLLIDKQTEELKLLFRE